MVQVSTQASIDSSVVASRTWRCMACRDAKTRLVGWLTTMNQSAIGMLALAARSSMPRALMVTP